MRHFCGGESKMGSCGGLPPNSVQSSGRARKGYPPVPKCRPRFVQSGVPTGGNWEIPFFFLPQIFGLTTPESGISF
jgi:hypothetical protein